MRKKIICYLCGGSDAKQRPGNVRDDARLAVMECNRCGLVFLNPFPRKPPSYYESSGMHGGAVDVAAWQRETGRDDKRRFIYLRRSLKHKTLLDVGCGNGGFLALARAVAGRAMGIEPEQDLQDHFKHEKLEVVAALNQAKGHFDVITLFHVLEHLPDPRAMLVRLAAALKPNGSLIVEVPHANDALLTLYGCAAFSRFTYWSCHPYLFTTYTLGMLAGQAGLGVHYIRQIQRYPLSNHLYWLAKGRPGGHAIWHAMDTPALHALYEKKLASQGYCDTLIASFSKT